MGKQQAAEQRRLALEEEKRQQRLERARVAGERAEQARKTQSKYYEDRERESHERLQRLRTRWQKAERAVAEMRAKAQGAASERIANWKARSEGARGAVLLAVKRRVQELMVERNGDAQTGNDDETPGNDTRQTSEVTDLRQHARSSSLHVPFVRANPVFLIWKVSFAHST